MFRSTARLSAIAVVTPRRSLRIRSAARIVYSPRGRMDLPRDAHSTYTLILLLSRPGEDSEGGHFLLEGHVGLELPLFGGVLVASAKPHGVSHVARGRRDVRSVQGAFRVALGHS